MRCERLEQEDLLGRLGEAMDPHVEKCGDCRTKRHEYLALVAALARESDRPLPDAWKQRALARQRMEHAARWRRKAIGTGLAFMALSVAILVVTRRAFESRDGEPTLSVRVEDGAATWRGPGQVGDRLLISATAGSAERYELRIYRDEREVARCPAPAVPACRDRDGTVELTWTVPTAGAYQIIWLVSSSPIPPPTEDLDADLRAGRQAGARLAADRLLDVY